MANLIDEASMRVREADNAAFSSQLAFLLGPDKFIEHINKTAEEARKRVEEEYAERPDNSGTEPSDESEPAAQPGSS